MYLAWSRTVRSWRLGVKHLADTPTHGGVAIKMEYCRIPVRRTSTLHPIVNTHMRIYDEGCKNRQFMNRLARLLATFILWIYMLTLWFCPRGHTCPYGTFLYYRCPNPLEVWFGMPRMASSRNLSSWKCTGKTKSKTSYVLVRIRGRFSSGCCFQST